MFQINNLIKQYGSPPQTVLDKINLTIPAGCVFGLLGPNGAGKTTLLSILVGLVPKNSGKVYFDGMDLDTNAAEIRASIGFVPQDFAFYPMLTARENLKFFAGVLGLSANEHKTQFDFCVKTAGLEQHIDKRAQNFSGGLKRRLNLAIGLLNKPKVLCLDEPTVGIDPHSRNFILETITKLNRQGITIIYTSHYMEEVEQICDQVAIIDYGRILIEGKTNELLKDRKHAELKLQFNKSVPQPLIQQLKQLYAVNEINSFDILIRTQDPAKTINHLTSLITDTELQIERLHYGFKNLEELFLSLTSKNLRDSVDE